MISRSSIAIGVVSFSSFLQLRCDVAVPTEPLPAGSPDDPTSPADTAGRTEPSLNDLGRPVGWTDDTHSNDATPRYDVVFADGKVNRLDITIAPADWQAMQDEMVALYGEPGAMGGAGGFMGGGGGAMPEGGALPTEMIDACAGMQEGDPCTAAMGPMSLAGVCTAVDEGLACIPEGMEGFLGEPPDGTASPPPEDGIDVGPGGVLVGAANPTYVPCVLEFEGSTWWYVGIRYKGQSSLMSTWSSGNGKLPLRLDFDAYEDERPEVDNQRFFGFKELSLASKIPS